MAIAYLLLAFWVVADHFERLPEVFMLILKRILGFLQEAAAGQLAMVLVKR